MGRLFPADRAVFHGSVIQSGSFCAEKTNKNSVQLAAPEKERSRSLDVLLAVALDAGLEDEGVAVEVVVRGDGAVLAAAAGVLHHHRHRQGDAAKVLCSRHEAV